jgi:hypothetical protein
MHRFNRNMADALVNRVVAITRRGGGYFWPWPLASAVERFGGQIH